jgi:basic membrane protein A
MRVSRLIAMLLGVNAVLVVAGALAVPPPAPAAGAGTKIGLVFDVGGKNDRSFNEAAWRGLERAKNELGVVIAYVEPTEGADRESALRGFAADADVDLVIAVGYIFSADLDRLAAQFPQKRFAGVDYSPTAKDGSVPPNVVGLRFREHEGSFVVGAIAGMITRTRRVGFVGGMEIPLIRKFGAGYAAGVKHACPTCRVMSAYAGTDPRAFADPAKGQELASAQYGAGADIIFHASGKTGDGVFAAARKRRARAIGVDSDQYTVAPCCVVTSMLKRVDVAVVDVIRAVIEGRFRGGIVELGLADGGIDFVADERNRRLLPDAVAARARQIADEIVAGAIVVPDR